MTREDAVCSLEKLRNKVGWVDEYDAINIAIEALEERKTGRWIRRHSKMWECSECERGCKWRENYCPDCGAKMEVDE